MKVATRWLKQFIKWGSWVAVLSLGLMVFIDIGTGYFVQERIYTRLTDLPYRENVIVLGTAKFYANGSPNLYYKYRLEAAKYLYYRGKASKIWLSGDNKTPYYNEPRVMTRDLEKMGIPSEVLYQDYAGYNTLDSIVRAKQVYQLEPFTIISQQFHCERALLIAKFKGIDAICYVAKYPESHYRVRIREFFARTVMLINLLFWGEASSLEPSFPKVLAHKTGS